MSNALTSDPITPSLCACGSQKSYTDCCQRYHQGEAAPTPETLMRSRFTAFVLKLDAYLYASWHSSTQPKILDLSDSPDWVSLRILDSGSKGDNGYVHFQAIYRLNSGWGYLQEISAFVKERERWYYLKGEPKEGILKPQRNAPCPCGSGKKFKTCCS
ncbi:MAG TPA: YchJ family protein [Marinospirillum sp.]|uniref:YchJ family protein n=1 Tax=Marinospirillum sp. TaxID=2183934 RepID=UPI002B4989B8|nr:YchJ family protein [Marinospirillum sp.]HKM14320.1 YchJ family protein [Marinospirillum sp.]